MSGTVRTEIGNCPNTRDKRLESKDKFENLYFLASSPIANGRETQHNTTQTNDDDDTYTNRKSDRPHV